MTISVDTAPIVELLAAFRAEVAAARKSAAPTPDGALSSISALGDRLDKVEALRAAEDKSAVEAAALLARGVEELGFAHLDSGIDDARWHVVSAAFDAFFARVADLADMPGPEQLGADGQKRRPDAIDYTLNAFYGGLYYTGKAAWWGVKTAVAGAVAAGRMAAPHVAAGAAALGRAGESAIVKVEAYVRADGTKVPAHERSAPASDKSGDPPMSNRIRNADSGIIRRALHLKSSDVAVDGTIVGYASLFGEIDDGLDIVQAGAFVDSLAEHKAAGTYPKMLWQHDPNHPIGVWTDIYEDGKGLVVKGRILTDVEKGREALALLRAKAIDGLSIGYCAVDHKYIDATEAGAKFGWYGGATSARQVRLLSKCELWETSIVTFPMLRTARVEDVKTASAPSITPADLAKLDTALGLIAEHLDAAEDRDGVDER